MLDEVCHRLADLIDPDVDDPRKIDFKNPQGRLRKTTCANNLAREKARRMRQAYRRGGRRKGSRGVRLSESWVRQLWYETAGRTPPATADTPWRHPTIIGDLTVVDYTLIAYFTGVDNCC